MPLGYIVVCVDFPHSLIHIGHYYNAFLVYDILPADRICFQLVPDTLFILLCQTKATNPPPTNPRLHQT